MPKIKVKADSKAVFDPCLCGSKVWAVCQLQTIYGDLVPGWQFMICVKCKHYKIDKPNGA